MNAITLFCDSITVRLDYCYCDSSYFISEETSLLVSTQIFSRINSELKMNLK